MKNLIAMLVVVLGLGITNAAEAKGGHGGHHGHHPAHHAHPGHARLGVHRSNRASRTWSRSYNRYFYSDPAVSGAYYWSETDRLYYPTTLLPVPQVAVKVESPR
jgi:hypothetical protein